MKLEMGLSYVQPMASRLARALWIEIFRSAPDGRVPGVEARESLVD